MRRLLPLTRLTAGSATCVWALDERAYVWRWDGLKFNQVEGPRLRHVSAAADGTVWALTAGAQRRLVCWTGDAWADAPSSPPGQVLAVAAASADAAWTLGSDGRMHRWSRDVDIFTHPTPRRC